MKKKVGIVTITRGMNFGNSLQNLAVILFLKKRNMDAETILDKFDSSHLNDTFISKIKSIIKIITNYRGERTIELYDIDRKKKYMEFDRKYIPFSKYYAYKNIPDKHLNSEYDYFITGSDIVWNPFYVNDFFFLKFAEKNKRISFAASLAVDELPQEYISYYKESLSNMNYISVREKKGAEIVSPLINDDVCVLSDPTLLIDSKEWSTIAEMPSWLTDDNYVIGYFLGELDEKISKSILSMCKENNLKFINLLDVKNKDWYIVNPSEFLYLIEHSKGVFTDSFHGTVFSIIYKRPFYAFSRKDKNGAFNKLSSRIINLLSMFNLDERLLASTSSFDYNDFSAIEFKCNEEVLAREVKKANDFLDIALK